jgi:hypothetical protein
MHTSMSPERSLLPGLPPIDQGSIPSKVQALQCFQSIQLVSGTMEAAPLHRSLGEQPSHQSTRDTAGWGWGVATNSLGRREGRLDYRGYLGVPTKQPAGRPAAIQMSQPEVDIDFARCQEHQLSFQARHRMEPSKEAQ